MNRSQIITIAMGLLGAGIFALGLFLFLHRPKVGAILDVIAKVTELKGSVEKRAFLNPEWETLAKGDDINDKDDLRTGSGASVTIEFTDKTQITIAENARVKLKPSSLKVDSGSIESESNSDNPFEIDAGNLSIKFNVKRSENLDVKSEEAYRDLITIKLQEAMQVKGSAKFVDNMNDKLALYKKGANIIELNKLWSEINRYVLDSKKGRKVKIEKADGGEVKAQVDKGEILLAMQGSAEQSSLKEGEGIKLDQGSGEAKKVKLLPAPVNPVPSIGSTVYNTLSVNCSWDRNIKAMSYKLELSQDQDFENIRYTTNIMDAKTVLPKLQFEKLYHWRVKAVDHDGFEGKPMVSNFVIKEDRTPPQLDIDSFEF